MPLDPAPLPSANSIIPHSSEDMARISDTHTDLGPDNTDEADTGMFRIRCYYYL